MPDPFAQYVTNDKDPFAAYAEASSYTPPAEGVMGQARRSAAVTSDAPDSGLDRLVKSDAIQGAAHPKGLGDMLSLLIPSGVAELAPTARRGYLTVKKAAQASPSLKKMPVDMLKGAYHWAMDSTDDVASHAFNEKPLYQQMEHLPTNRPAPERMRVSDPPVTAPPEAAAAALPKPQWMPTPPSEATMSASERAGLAKQNYSPETIAKIEAQMTGQPTKGPTMKTAMEGPFTPEQQTRLDNAKAGLDKARADMNAVAAGRFNKPGTLRTKPTTGAPATWRPEFVVPGEEATFEGPGAPLSKTPITHDQPLTQTQDTMQAMRRDPDLVRRADAMKARADAAKHPIAVDQESLPQSWRDLPHPLDPERVDVGAQATGRAHGMTKQQVRDVATPILDAKPGDASPILPEASLKRIVDTLKALPPGSAEREAYVAKATSGKAQWQVENIRRTLEHLGLVVPVAVGAKMRRDSMIARMGQN